MNKTDVMVSVSQKDSEALDESFARLVSELVRLKRLGAAPKSRKFSPSVLKRAVFALGLEKIKEMDWKQFDEYCCGKGIYIRGRK